MVTLSRMLLRFSLVDQCPASLKTMMNENYLSFRCQGILAYIRACKLVSRPFRGSVES